MYSYEERLKAVLLYIKYDHCAARVIRELGYPNRHTLQQWFQRYQRSGTLSPQKRKNKFSQQQIEYALQYYAEHGESATRTVADLGYPSLTVFKTWLNEAFPYRKKRSSSGGKTKRYSDKKKEQAVIDFCTRKCSAEEIAKAHGISRVTLYKWKKQLFDTRNSHLR